MLLERKKIPSSDMQVKPQVLFLLLCSRHKILGCDISCLVELPCTLKGTVSLSSVQFYMTYVISKEATRHNKYFKACLVSSTLTTASWDFFSFFSW